MLPATQAEEQEHSHPNRGEEDGTGDVVELPAVDHRRLGEEGRREKGPAERAQPARPAPPELTPDSEYRASD